MFYIYPYIHIPETGTSLSHASASMKIISKRNIYRSEHVHTAMRVMESACGALSRRLVPR